MPGSSKEPIQYKVLFVSMQHNIWCTAALYDLFSSKVNKGLGLDMSQRSLRL